MENKDSHSSSTLDDVRIIDLPRHKHANGSLTVAENTEDFPFAVRRVFYLYDVPSDSERGGHSHFEEEEIIVAPTGSFEVELSDGVQTRRWRLDRPFKGLYVPSGIWRTLDNFSGGSVCLVLASTTYDEADYVRDYDCFLTLTASKRK